MYFDSNAIYKSETYKQKKKKKKALKRISEATVMFYGVW